MIAITLTIAAVCAVLAIALLILHRWDPLRFFCIVVLCISLAVAGIAAFSHAVAGNHVESVNTAVVTGLQATMGVDRWPPKGMNDAQRIAYLEGATARYLRTDDSYPSAIAITNIVDGHVTTVRGTMQMPHGRGAPEICPFVARVTLGKYNPAVSVRSNCPG